HLSQRESQFHLSPDGITNVLTYAGLHVLAVWPQEGWLVFDSLSRMPGPVSWPSRQLLKAIATLERAIRRRSLHPRSIGSGQWLRRKPPPLYRDQLPPATGSG